MSSRRRYRCLSRETVGEGAFELATVQDGHIESIRQWRNAQMNVLRQSSPIGEDKQERYFDEVIWPSLGEMQPANLLLAFLEDGALIGYGGLVHVAWNHARAEVSFLLDPRFTRDADAYSLRFEAFLGLLSRVAFDDLGLHRLYTETYAWRTDHIAALERSGFALEGKMRDHVRCDGEFCDSLLHGKLAPLPQDKDGGRINSSSPTREMRIPAPRGA
jgi:hypothetical protein